MASWRSTSCAIAASLATMMFASDQSVSTCAGSMRVARSTMTCRPTWNISVLDGRSTTASSSGCQPEGRVERELLAPLPALHPHAQVRAPLPALQGHGHLHALQVGLGPDLL